MSQLLVLMALPEEIPNLPKKYRKYVHFTGIGKVNAAIHTFEKIQMYEPDLIINFGTAGAMNKKLSGLVECGTFINKDNGVSKQEMVVFNPDKATILSSDSFSTAHDSEFDLVDMEAYAIAAVCSRRFVNFKCYKYVSDYPGSNSVKEWEGSISDGEPFYLEVLDDYLKNAV